MTATTANAPTTAGQIAPSLHVFTRPPVAVREDARIVAWSRRSTEKNPVPEAERYRGIVVAASALKVPDDACASKFQRLLAATVHKLADEMFTAWCKQDGNLMKAEYDGASLDTDSVLNYWAEERQRETIDGAAITAWLKQSATLAAMEAGSAQHKAWLAIMPKLAAPGYKGALKPEQASAAILRIKDEDAEHAVCAFIMQRLTNIIEGTADQLAAAL